MKRIRSFTRRCFAVALLIAIGWSTYGCSDSATVNPEVELADLSVTVGSTPAPLLPSFSPGTTSYGVRLSNNATTVTVSARPAVSGDTVSIDDQPTTSRVIDLGQPVPSESTKLVRIVVSESNSRSRTYTVLMRRAALAGNNSLQSLTMSPGSLVPTFRPETTSYEVDVSTDVTSVIVTATKADSNAVISGDLSDQGQATIPLNGPGTSKIVLVTVTAPNGDARTYRITVNRAAPMNNNNLSALSVSVGNLLPSFSPGNVNYSVEVPASVDRVTVSATKSDPNAVMSAFGSVIAAAGVPTGQVSATPGLGATISVPIIVIAPDGSQKTYTITVSRSAR